MAQKPNHPLVRAFIADHRLKWSAHHIAVGVSNLNNWTRWCAAHDLDLTEAAKADCSEFLAERADAVGASTLLKGYQFLRWFYAWLLEEGELPGRNPMAGIKAPRQPVHDPKRTPHITPDVYAKLMASFDKRKLLDCRNAAICSLMYRSGVRGVEVGRIDLDRVDLDHAKLSVVGKSGRWEVVHLTEETVRLIERYLRRRPATERSPALFVASAATPGEGRLQQAAVAEMLERRGKALGLRLPVHAFRRAMAINAKTLGMNDTTVQHIGRWTDPRMVARYQRNAQADLAAAEFHAADPTARPSSRRRLRSVG